MSEKDELENSSPDESEARSNGAVLQHLTGDPQFTEMLQRVPPEQRDTVLEVIEAGVSHSGWLPTPDFLRQYEDALPGLAERIVAMPEREQAHRHKVVETMVERDYDLKERGQNYALISVVLLLAFGGLLIFVGEYEWAARVAIFAIAGIVGIFVTGKWADIKSAKTPKEGEEP